jgi:hypothetical protein
MSTDPKNSIFTVNIVALDQNTQPTADFASSWHVILSCNIDVITEPKTRKLFTIKSALVDRMKDLNYAFKMNTMLLFHSKTKTWEKVEGMYTTNILL